MGGYAITIDGFVSDEVIAASGTYSYILVLERFNPIGYFSLQVKVSGSGTLKCDYYLSNNGADYVVPNGASAIFTGLTAGDALYSFNPELSKYLKLLFTETSGANSVTLSGWLALQ